MSRLLIASLFACACGRVTSPSFEDTLDPVTRTSTSSQTDAGSDAGTVAQDAGTPTCTPSAAEIFDPNFPPAPMPARFATDFRSANINARRLARAQTTDLLCPDEAWAWVTPLGLPDEEVVVITAWKAGRRVGLATFPAQGIVRHLELIRDPQAGGWVVAWATENRGLFTAVVDENLGPALPQLQPTTVMDPLDPHPFELTYAFDQPLVLVQRETPDHLRMELVVSSVALARGTPRVEHHVDLASALDASWGPLPAPAAILLPRMLYVRTAFQITQFTSPTDAVNSQGFAGGWHDSQIVYLPRSPRGEGGPVIVAAGQGMGTRRYEYEVSCFSEQGGRCGFWAEVPGSTWGGFDVWNHSGMSAAACGRKLAVAVRSFDSIGECASYGYCRAGDLHLVLIEEQVFPPIDRNLTPRDAPPDAGGFIGYDDQDVSSPIVFARSELNREWPFADVAWIQATADGGVELKLERNAADCSP